MGPSAHLSWAELACKDGTPYPERWRVSRAVPLAKEFEKIRAACWNKAIIIGSGYRTEAHNRRVGGARLSQHVQGRALDLYPPRGVTLRQFYAIIRGIAQEEGSKLRGLGLYPSFVHIDIRPSDRLIHWTTGTRPEAEMAA